MTIISGGELTKLCARAAVKAGADVDSARILAEATVEAERAGNRAVGVNHFFDYLDGYTQGRILNAKPVITNPAPAVLSIDAGGGLAQQAFAEVLGELVDKTRQLGLTALWINGSYTCGELGYYSRAVSTEGLIGVAAANSPALMSVGGSQGRILGTNPLSYGIPRPGSLPVVIDQASSATAFVNIRRAADSGGEIPAGWALDQQGEATTNPKSAIEGTLLPFGGHRGGNIAILVEILATLAGGNFSVDAPDFDRGERSPGIGVFLLCINPDVFHGSVDRLIRQFDLLSREYGVHLPAMEKTALADEVEINDKVLTQLRAVA